MASLGWLHFSGLRFGIGDRWPDSLLFADLERLHDRSGPWDLVILSGDLTLSGRPAQFNVIDRWLGGLWDRLHLLGSTPTLLTVPGNHDARRLDPASAEVARLSRWRSSREEQEEFWSSPDALMRRLVHKAFGAYSKWQEAAMRSFSAGLTLAPGVLPGDFAATLTRPGLRLGAVGLNSVFLRFQQISLEFPPLVDVHQLDGACPDGAEAWAKGHDLCLLMTHHSAHRLDAGAREQLYSEIAPAGRFVMHLSGRSGLHSSQTETMGVVPLRVELEAPPFCGQADAGYMSGRLDLWEAQRGQIRIWPRRIHRQASGAVSIGPDRVVSFLENDEGSRPLAFTLLRPPPSSAAPPEATPRRTVDDLRRLPLTDLQGILDEGPTVELARAALGADRHDVLRALVQGYRAPAQILLPIVAQIIGLEPIGAVDGDVLRVRLPQTALVMKRQDTVLTLLDGDEEPALALQARLIDIGWHPTGPPPLVILRGDEPLNMPGSIVLRESDLLALAWTRDPKRLLASLLWQRSGLDTLSPYRASGVVASAAMFFGRQAELHELAAAGERQALLIVGPRKVGKSSLLNRANDEIRREGGRSAYAVIRQTITSPTEIIDELISRTRLDCAPPGESGADYRQQVAALGRFIRRYLDGYTLLLDEADNFLYQDRLHGGAGAEELRALVQEGTCSIALAGYGTLYQATLSQADAAYNLGKSLFLGPLLPDEGLQLATLPMERIGISWAASQLAARVVRAVGGYPHLIQEACGRLLSRVRGYRLPVLNEDDVTAVLGDWRPPSVSHTLREMLVQSIEVNLSGPAQAAVWLLGGAGQSFASAELEEVLRGAGFDGLTDGQHRQILQALRISGACRGSLDRHEFAVPLLVDTVTELDVKHRVRELLDRWRALSPAERARFDFWGGNGSRKIA